MDNPAKTGKIPTIPQGHIGLVDPTNFPQGKDLPQGRQALVMKFRKVYIRSLDRGIGLRAVARVN